MPGIVLFNRRWGFGSDDLVFPGLLEITFRTLWLITVTAVFVHHQESFACTSGYLLVKIYQVIIAVLVLHIVSAVSVVWAATRGTILDTTARKHVPVLLYIKFFLVLPELAWIGISTYWAFQHHEDCSLDAVLTVKAAILIDCGVAIVVAVGTAILFDPVGELGGNESTRKHGLLAQQTRKVWEKRIKLLFCCFPGDQHSRMAFKDIAQHITVFFKDMDVVPTDIAAGLVLLYQYENTQRQLYRQTLNTVTSHSGQNRSGTQPVLQNMKPSTSNTSTHGDSDSEQSATVNSNCNALPNGRAATEIGTSDDWTRIGLLVHYMRFAMASYGWPFYIMMHPKRGCCQMVGCCRCCCPVAMEASVNDNCFQGNTRAILKLTGLRLEDVLYANFHNSVYEVPFFVALDHGQRALVVAIRGTMSIWDVLTDLTSDSEELDVRDQSGQPVRAHKGMAQAARNVLDKLRHLDLLSSTFTKYPDYKLIVTGHSLGAGTAAIVTLLLRDEYPSVRCYAFSPAAALSKSAAEQVDEFVCSVVVGEDLVPRLTFLTMLHLRDRIHHQLRETREPKYKILASGLWYLVCGLSGALEKSLFRREDAATSSGESETHAPLLGNEPFRNDYAAFGMTTDDENEDETKTYSILYPPGKILHITNYSRTGTERVLHAWAKSSAFDHIVVHPTMLFDHLPDQVYKALKMIEKQTESTTDSTSESV